MMIPRIRTGLVARNPYYLSDATWGITYVTHGLAGVGLVGLVIAHVYFAVRPEKWWITKSMILGFITRRQYLEHHEPSRWPVGQKRLEREAGGPRVSQADTVAELSSRINIIEEAYEFMLAYASQGLSSDQDNDTGRQAREYLKSCDAALSGLPGVFTRYVEQRRRCSRPRRTTPSSRSSSTTRRNSQAAIQLVLAQPAISSQMVDNLNASIHLRALLTDLFLIDEIFKSRRS